MRFFIKMEHKKLVGTFLILAKLYLDWCDVRSVQKHASLQWNLNQEKWLLFSQDYVGLPFHLMSIFSQHVCPLISKGACSEQGNILPLMWVPADVRPLPGALTLTDSSLTREWKVSWFHSLLKQVGQRSCSANLKGQPGHLVRLEWQ